MPDGRKISISATDPLGRAVVVYQSTLDAHRSKHQEPFSDKDVYECVSSPTIIAKSGHAELTHKDRYVYYKDDVFIDGGPRIMKTVVEHGEKPGVLTSAFRTSKRSADGAIVYMDEDFKKGMGKWSR